MNSYKHVIALILTLSLIYSLFIGGLELTSSAAGTSLSTGDRVTFGSYPQTRVTDENLLEYLNSQNLAWKSYEYYIGDGSHGSGTPSDYMKYADVTTYNGNKYRAVKFTSYRPRGTCNLSSAQFSYQDDNGYYTDTVYWFKFEPIVWRVLDPDNGLLMTSQILDSQAFENEDYWDDVYHQYYGDADYNHYSSNWAFSSLRVWLNRDFCDTAFSGSEQGYICETDLTTPSPNKSEFDADPTTDKVFLLSYDDVLNSSYGFYETTKACAGQRLAFGTDYAKCQGLLVSEVSSSAIYWSGASWWYLRSPITSATYIVREVGSVENYYLPYSSAGGVRAALNIPNLQSAINQGIVKRLNGSGDTGEHFPAGYNFYKDSFSFENDLGVDISKKYFDGIFEAGSASLAYNKKHTVSNGGLCYGMAVTTASIYNGFPAISSWFSAGESSGSLTKIRNLHRDGAYQARINGNFNDSIRILDFIKYAFIYQWSVSAIQNWKSVSSDSRDLLTLVKNRTDADQMGTVIALIPKDGHEYAAGGHAVLAVGYQGNDILIDNPNNSNNYERLTVHNDGSWEFGSYNSVDHNLFWDVATHRPYQILLTGNKVGYYYASSSANSINDLSVLNEERYVLGTEKLNPDYNLVSVSSADFEINNEDYVILSADFASDKNSETKENTLFWVKEGELQIEGLNDETNTVICAGDDKIIAATSCAGSAVSINVQEAEAKIEAAAGQNADLSFTTVIEGDLEDTEICVKTEGIAVADQVSASMTDDGIAVDGIAEGTVSLIVNDVTVAEKAFKKSDAAVEISYDNTGISDTLEVSNDETPNHDDPASQPSAEVDNLCKYCGKPHTGFFGKFISFFHSILYFFKNLFKK